MWPRLLDDEAIDSRIVGLLGGRNSNVPVEHPG
jgi:hypothetical protein